MQLRTKSSVATLIMTGLTMLSFHAKGATIASGELMVWFRASGGSGATTTVASNLGSGATVFRDGTGTFNVGSSLGTVLSTTYGTTWYSRNDLFWGIAGANSSVDAPGSLLTDPYRTSYVTVATGASAPVVANSTDATSLTAILNDQLRIRFRNESGTTYVNTVKPSIALDTSLSNTWEDFNNGTTSFGLAFSAENNFSNGVAGANLDLYRVLAIGGTNGLTGVVAPNNAALEGTFAISQAGQISFSAAAAAVVPEPSRMLLAGVGLVALGFRRRRHA